MLALEPGSVIAFGSRPNYQWVCDTVLVVREAIEHKRTDYEALLGTKAAELAFALTLRPMYSWPKAQGPFNAMFGATPEQTVEGMFSFVPCRPAADGVLCGFTRPRLLDHPAINPSNTQAVSQNKQISVDEFQTRWCQIADTVTAAGLALATRLDPPAADIFEHVRIG